MSNQKTYVPKSKAKVQKTSFGDILKLGFHAESLIDFIKQHTNEKGYINLDVVPRRDADQYGNTHYISLNDFRPTAKTRDENSTRNKETAPIKSKSDDDTDVPF